ncbi:MAG: NAD(P)/FAD-dependent oxidoreductase, partial [Mesorhizobium sp.]
IDAKTRSVITAGATFKAAVANVIPAQMAGRLAQQAGLANRSGWCPVDPVTFESALQPGVHLVGDAIIGGDMPKS